MVHNIFPECEDPDLVDLELEMGCSGIQFGLSDTSDFDLSMDTSELDEIELLQEEMEATLLEDPGLAEKFSADEPMLEPILPEGGEQLPMAEDSSVEFERVIAFLKNYPGLKITFSF